MDVHGRREPQRSCISCRREGAKEGFLRFVLAPDGVVTPDLEEKLPGRGAYTCVSRRCLIEAVLKKQFVRSFKGKARQPDTEQLDTLVQQMMQSRIGGYLALAAKAGALMTGGDAVERALRSHTLPHLVVLSTDMSRAIAERLSGMAERAGIKVLRALNKDLIGRLVGKESDRSAVVVQSDGFARSLNKEIERYRSYLEEESCQ